MSEPNCCSGFPMCKCTVVDPIYITDYKEKCEKFCQVPPHQPQPQQDPKDCPGKCRECGHDRCHDHSYFKWEEAYKVKDAQLNQLIAEFASLRQVAHGLRGELSKWTEKYRCCDGKPDCANNKLQKLCHDLLGDDWTDKHEAVYDIVASAETGEDWAKANLSDAKKEIADLQAKLSVAIESLANLKKHFEYCNPEMFEKISGWKIVVQALAQIEEITLSDKENK